MISAPIQAALLRRDATGRPVVSAYADRATPAEAELTLLAGNDLPARWQGRDRFVVLAIGFGVGHSFLATWKAWRQTAARCERLVCIAIEPSPLARADLRASLLGSEAGHDLCEQLCAAWPPLTHNLHRLAFDDDRVQLMLAFGPVRAWLPELVAEVDAFYLDGMADESDVRRCKALGRLAARGATLAAYGPAPGLATALRSAGFVPQVRSTGAALAARFAPEFTPRRAPSRPRRPADVESHALVVGAGLAGTALACALAAQGWRSTLIERRAAVASAASGNPAGLFHGIVNAQDGVHARFNRAAAMSVAREAALAIQDGTQGALEGLLRLEHALPHADMQAMLQRLGLPVEYVRATNPAETSALAGRPTVASAWFYPQGGWIDPAGLARHYLRRAGAAAELRTGLEACALERGPRTWRLIDRHGEQIAESATVVLANAFDALRLLGDPDWPAVAIRGQISVAEDFGFTLPRIPMAGSGYLLPSVDGRAMFGATAQAGDRDPAVRPADHAANIRQLEKLLGGPAGLDTADLAGRTGWRCSAKDRLPLIGPVPDTNSLASRRDQPRFIPRQPGLYVLSGLGSRGIAWSALGAQVLAACIAGAPVPLEASLVDAIDPARFASRRPNPGPRA